MSQDLGGHLPPSLFRKLHQGERKDAQGEAVVLLTVDRAGFPHVALISWYEVVALDRGTLRLALRATSQSSQNLRERRIGTLVFVGGGAAYYAKGRVEAESSLPLFPDQTAFRLRMEQVLEDKKRGIPLLHGIRFRLPKDPKFLQRGKALLHALKKPSAGGVG